MDATKEFRDRIVAEVGTGSTNTHVNMRSRTTQNGQLREIR